MAAYLCLRVPQREDKKEQHDYHQHQDDDAHPGQKSCPSALSFPRSPTSKRQAAAHIVVIRAVQFAAAPTDVKGRKQLQHPVL